MKQTLGGLTILLGIIASVLFFLAGNWFKDAGTDLTEVKSISGDSIAEVYYQGIGKYGVAYSLIANAMGFGVLAISLGVGGILFELRGTIDENNLNNRLIYETEGEKNTAKEFKVEAENQSETAAQLNMLKGLIEKEKGSLFGGKHKQEIIELVKEYSNTKNDALKLNEKYAKVYGESLIDDLKGLSNNYGTIKDYLSVYIDNHILDSKYPHEVLTQDEA